MSWPIHRECEWKFSSSQSDLYIWKKEESRSGLKGCCSNCVKKCKGPKIKTPGISRERAPDRAEQFQQIGLHAYAKRSGPSSVAPRGSASKSLAGRAGPSVRGPIHQPLHDKGCLNVPFLINQEDINKYVLRSSPPCGESLTPITRRFSPAGWSVWLITASWSCLQVRDHLVKCEKMAD